MMVTPSSNASSSNPLATSPSPGWWKRGQQAGGGDDEDRYRELEPAAANDHRQQRHADDEDLDEQNASVVCRDQRSGKCGVGESQQQPGAHGHAQGGGGVVPEAPVGCHQKCRKPPGPQPDRGYVNRHQQLSGAWQTRNRMSAGSVDQGDEAADRKQRPGPPGGHDSPGQQCGSKAQAEQAAKTRAEHRDRRITVEREARELAKQRQWFGGDKKDYACTDETLEAFLTVGEHAVGDGPERQREAREVHPAGQRLQRQPERSCSSDLSSAQQR